MINEAVPESIKIGGHHIFPIEVMAYGYDKSSLSDLLLYLTDGTVQKIPATERDRVLRLIRATREPQAAASGLRRG